MEANGGDSSANEDNEKWNLIEIHCSAKRLKTLFYCNPIPVCDHDNEPTHKTTPFTDLLNWPGVSIKIIFPNFELIRENRNYSKYKLFFEDTKLTNQSIQQQTTSLQVKRSSLKRVTFISSFICEYLKQIQKLIEQLAIPAVKKYDLMHMMSEFSRDVSLCDPTIDIGIEYFKNLTKYPYVRYLGKPIEKVKLANNQDFKPDPKIRLQEITYPVLYFCLSKFAVCYNTDMFDKVKFVLDDCQSYFTKNKWVTFECRQCDKVFEGLLAMYELDAHLTAHHGHESNWTCTVCGKVYTTRNLSNKRWYHYCDQRTNKSYSTQ